MWEELKKTALLGTDRHQIPEKELAYLAKMNLDLEQDPALVLLDALTIWNNMKKVGLNLQKWDTLLENPSDSDLQNPTLKLADAIAALFKYNGFEILVPQTIQLLNQKEIAFPSELYPDLIAYFDKHQQEFLRVYESLDDRFYWLIKQNNAWTAFDSEQTEAQIEKIKTLDLKALALQQFAHQKGEAAIGYIYNEWESYSKPFQKSFLAHYTPESSAVLDSLYDKIALEGDKDTYRYALRYFARSHHEPFLNDIKGLLSQLIYFKGNKLVVNEDAIKQLKNLFLKKHLPIFKLDKGYGFDVKNSLFNFFSIVPLTFLCDTLECTWPTFLSALVEGDEIHELILLGLCYSAGQNPIDQELFLQTLLSGKFRILEEMDLLPVYETLTSAQLQKLYLQLIANKFSFKDNAMEMLLLCPHFKWPNALCKEVMKVLPIRLLNATDTKQDPNFIQFRNMVLNCNAELYSYINAAFQANPVYSWNSTKIIEKQLKILKMRWQIGQEVKG